MELTERPVNLVHASLLGLGSSRPVDARLSLQTKIKIGPYSDLAKFVFNKGFPDANAAEPLVKMSGGHIQLSEVTFTF